MIVLAFARTAHARPRPRFEPTDLELETPGMLDIDVHRFELDLDGAYAIEGVDPGTAGPSIFDHAAPDNLWLSAKLGIADWHAASDDAWAVGAQLGPKLPAANGTHGVGVEGILLVARMKGPRT
ncbi:MAG TPA: hypothetical protein VL463_17470 [Kofleriaceae bacterium]|jgi:hypothetical protein|nr:hypothetical protein [Kofleriaceae bacterium]